MNPRALLIIGLAWGACAAAADVADGRKAQPSVAAPPNVEFAGGDGNGCDRAVVLRGSTGSRDIVASEVAWLRTRYPGYKLGTNTVETRGRRTFEEITIETAAGERKVVCFDITEGFGHF